MTSFLHCNICFSSSFSNKYAVGSCFHLTCVKCAPRGNNICPKCKKEVKFVPIDNSMNVELKKYFMDPVKLIEEEMTFLRKRIEFQDGISNHLLERLLKEEEKRRKMIENMAAKDKEREKELQFKNEWIAMAEKKLKEASKEKEEFTRRCNELKSQISKISQVPVSNRTSNFSFNLIDSDATSIGGSSNSSFSVMSPIVSSPTPSNEDFFQFPNQNSEFKTPKIPKNGSDTSTFSEAFNTIFTPSREGSTSLQKSSSPNQTCVNRTSLSDSMRYDVLEADRRDLSLPSAVPLLAQHSRRENEEENYRTLNRELRFEDSVRQLRRSSSKQGVVTRKSIIPSSYLDLDSRF